MRGFSPPPALRATGYFARSYRRTWRASVMSTFISPTLYLLAMGVGLGSFVNKGGNAAALGHVHYLQFVAPALAATTAALTAASESMFPVMGAIKWHRTYYAMLATPLRVGDVLAGHLVWICTRVATAVAAYLVVMAAFGTTPSIEAAAVLPAGILLGLAFSAPMAAFAATQENDGAFSLVFRLGMIPLFLFSGVFFPISVLPVGLRVIAYGTPLWHGVDLCRQLTLGRVDPAMAVVHVAYLLALAALGVFLASRTYSSRLRT
ncbi:MAG: ABC transporter permease [Acidimicrobiales bacterium]